MLILRRRGKSADRGVNDTGSFRDRRTEYRVLWDAYLLVAQENSRLRQEGKQPSPEQVAQEERAATAADQARNTLLDSISRSDN